MSRTAFPRTLMATAVLFGLVSTGFVSIAFVKAPHSFPSHRAVMAKSYAANRSATARLFWRIRSPVERAKLRDPRRRKDLGGA